MIIYWIRVFIISFEFLIITSFLIAYVYNEAISNLIKEILINDDVLKWLTFVPAALLSWCFAQTPSLLFPSGESSKILHKWPSYKKFKIHCVVGLVYSVLFFIIGLLPLFMKNGVNSGTGFIMLLCGIAGESIVALSIYSAQISVKEILMHAES